METSPNVRNRARFILLMLLLIAALSVVLGSGGTSSAQIYSNPSSPPASSPATSPPPSSPPACRSAGATCPSNSSSPPIVRGDGPEVEGNELFPHGIDDGPNVLDERFPNNPQERGVTVAGEGNLPFTGADLTLFLLLGAAAITIGLILLRAKRRSGTTP